MPRWDSTSKDKQRLLIQQQRPWMRATGPRSEYGRRISSRNAAKKKKPLSLDVTLMSLQTNEGDTERPLEIGDRVKYIGGYQPTMLFCGHESMVVSNFCGTGAICASQQRFAIACRTSAGQLIWIYSKDLQRCPDGQSNHESGNQS